MRSSTFRNSCALAFAMAIFVLCASPTSARLANGEESAVDTAMDFGNALHKRLQAEIRVVPEMLRDPENIDLPDTAAQRYPQILRRQLAKHTKPDTQSDTNQGCTLDRKCSKKPFKDCDFTGCQNLESLQLSGKQISGELPAALQILTQLSSLDLSNNQLSGSVQNLTSLTQLTELNIKSNKFSGSVDPLGKLTKLTELKIDYNEFSGSAEAIGNLNEVIKLKMGSNQLTGNAKVFANLAKLQNLDIESNLFDGPAETFGTLTALRDLNIAYNEFTGYVTTFGDLPELTSLGIGNNQFEGGIQDLSKLNKLTQLRMGSNTGLNGTVDTLGKLTLLTKLRIDYNNFHGDIEALSELTNLTILHMQSNEFSGTVTALGKLSKLKELQINHNNFTGNVNDLDFPDLVALHVESNHFTGQLHSLASMSKLERMYLQSNHFSGNVESLGALTKLKRMQLSNNQLNGSIAALGKLTNMEYLDVQYNDFTGTLEALDQLTKLRHLYVNSNRFNGSIDFVKDMTKLNHLYLGNNHFAGNLTSLENLTALSVLYIASLGDSTNFNPPVPNLVFKLAPEDLYGLKLSCQQLADDRRPTLVEFTGYVPIGAKASVQCDKNEIFPMLYDGKWEPIVITSGNCSAAGYSVIPTSQECAYAAKKLDGKRKIVETAEHFLPYCGWLKDYGAYIFDTTSMREGEGIHLCSDRYRCVCKKATAQSNFKCMFSNDSRAHWEPNLTNYKCIGLGACKKDDPTAINLKKARSADVETCTSLQDGDVCNDFTCTNNYHVRQGVVECSYQAWESETTKICDFCESGKYKVNDGCENCEPGTYLLYGKQNSTSCMNCSRGEYQPNHTKSECLDCAKGWYQPDEGQTKCLECSAGQISAGVEQSTCMECQIGTYQDQSGQSICKTCTFDKLCISLGEKDPPFNFFLIIAPPTLVGLIILVYQIIKVCIKAASVWKPQSDADAHRARMFVLPKTADGIHPSMAVFKTHEKRFVAKGWTENERLDIEAHRDQVVQYLGERVQQATHSDEVRTMQCCVKMDALHDFQTLYVATMKNIRNKERDGFKEYTQVSLKLIAASPSECRLNPSKLVDLYNSGRAVYDRFHTFLATAVEASPSGYLYKTGRKHRRPKMKGIYRVLEKGVFKYNENLTDDLDLSQVRDLVRGGIIDLTMRGLSKIARYILESDAVTICRVKDRFNNPSAAGWTDLMVNFYLNEDPGKHVCEVQLIHFKMLSQRTTQEGHDAYNVYRSASELLKRSKTLSSSLAPRWSSSQELDTSKKKFARVSPMSSASPTLNGPLSIKDL